MNLSRNTKLNLLFTAGVAAVAAMLFYLTRPVVTGSPYVAVLQYGEPQTTQEIPLDTETTYDFTSAGYTIHLQVRDGSIAFVNSPCPDHTCEGFGFLKAAGDWAACLPARASVTIQEKTT